MKLSNLKLAAKTSVITASILTVSFIILIGASVKSAGSAVTTAINGEFSGIANQNGLMVQGILDDATGAAQNLQDFLDHAYEEYDIAQEEQTVDSFGLKAALPTDKSVIYGVDILESNHEIENYILNTTWAVVKNNPFITGMGLYFEPYAFDAAIKDYTLYVGDKDADNKTAQSYGSYSEYSITDYYKVPSETLKPYFTKPYVDQGATMITASYPIISKGSLKGILTVDIGVDKFTMLKSTDEKYPTMNVNVLTQDGTYVYDAEGIEWSGADMREYFYHDSEYQSMITSMGKNESFTIRTTRENGSQVARYCYPIMAGQDLWWAQSILDVKDLNKNVTGLTVLMVSMSVIALLLIIAAITIFLRRMLKPIDAVVDAAKEIANGNLDIHIEISSQDEIGILASTFQSMAKDLSTIIDDVGWLLGEMGLGNFRVNTRHEDKYVGQYKKLLLSVREINSNLSNTLLQINQAADQVSGGSEQVSAGAQALSEGTTEQASSIEELAATINEISAQVKETAHNAAQARSQTSAAEDQVTVCSEKMQEMTEAMSDITHKSTEIGKIIKTIEDIAFQTNILALNAAVEAARAGAAGKGFAVVADEVRNLAGKSAEASKSTSGLIEGSIQAVERGTNIANETAGSLLKVVTSSQEVFITVDKIAKAADEEACALAQITSGIDQISNVVQTNSATAEESAAASEELSGQSQILKNLVNRFKLK